MSSGALASGGAAVVSATGGVVSVEGLNVSLLANVVVDVVPEPDNSDADSEEQPATIRREMVRRVKRPRVIAVP